MVYSMRSSNFEIDALAMQGFPRLMQSEMVESSDSRCWDEMFTDTLGVVFSRLSLRERLTVIPQVCKAWRDVVEGPYCWSEIDIEELNNDWEPDQLNRMVEMLITRSSGSVRKLCVPCLKSDRIYTFIAEKAPSLQTLRLPRSNITDVIVEKIAGRLSKISFLDVSYCMRIGADALVTIGNNFKLLEGLCRNMHPVDTAGKPLDDAEAHAIASTMPKLKHLEMAYHRISTEGVSEIHSSCPELEFLDLRGCWGVQLETLGAYQNSCLTVLGPAVEGYYESSDEWEDSSDFSDASDYHIGWGFVVGEDDYDYGSDDEIWDHEGQLEIRFYQGNDDGGVYWPPSP